MAQSVIQRALVGDATNDERGGVGILTIRVPARLCVSTLHLLRCAYTRLVPNSDSLVLTLVLTQPV